MINCAITSQSKTTYTCLTKNDLIDIASKLKITFNNTSKKKVYDKLTSVLGLDETKWVLPFKGNEKIKDKLKNLTFKIHGPLKDTSWLTNIHINKIMYQIVKKFNNDKKYNFIFYDTLSADEFKIYPEKLLEIKEYIDSGKNVGIIFNNDIKKLPGSHWTAVYITKKHAYFFDSNGDKPNKHIQLFLNSFPIWSYNNIQYQMIDGDCGLWAITFLIKKSKGENITHSDNDKNVNKLRKKFFM